MTDESIIGADGSLKLSSNEVTWFSFLQLSRSTNSEKQGWNSKTYWIERGLDRLVSEKGAERFLAAWTRHSLADTARPVVRDKDFKFKERKEALERDNRAGKTRLKEGSENSINWEFARELFKQGIVFTYEVPLAGERKGQLKVDVMVSSGDGQIEIVELKRSGDKCPDPPLMALTEGICYALQTKRCWPHLSKALPNVNSGEPLVAINLILAGPGYWNNCNEAGGIQLSQVSKLDAIVKAVEAELSGVQLSLSLADIGEDGRNLRPIKESPTPPPWSILSSGNLSSSTK